MMVFFLHGISELSLLKNDHIWIAWNATNVMPFLPHDIPGLALLFPLLTAQCTVAH